MSKMKAKSGNEIKVFIVDDHPIVRQGLVELIGREDDMVVCGQADNAAEALRGIAKATPQAAIIDYSLKDGNGLDLTRDVRDRHPNVAVLMLSMHDASIYAERALRAGARGYLMKEDSTEKVIGALRAILRGDIYLPENVQQRILLKAAAGGVAAGASPVDVLSDRELEVFRLLGQGVSTRDIAVRLHRSVKTVDSHRENIKRKLRLNSATDLLQHAIRWVQSEAR